MASMHRRIGLTYSLLIILVFIGLGVLLSNFLSSFYMTSLEENLAETAYLLAGEEALTRDWPLTEDSETRISVIDPEGKVLFESEKPEEELDDHSDRPEIRQAYAGETGQSIRFSETTRQEMLYIAVPIRDEEGQVRGVVRLARPLTLINQSINRIQILVFLTLLLTLALIWLIGFFNFRSITGSLARLADRAQSIGGGSFPHLEPVEAKDELGKLELVFNEMSHNLKNLVKNLENEKERTISIIRQLPVGVVVIDRRGQIRASNPLFYRLLNISPPVRDREALLNLTSEPELIEFVKNLWTKEEEGEKEIELDRPARHLHLAASPLNHEQQQMVIVLQDISRIRRLERMRREFVANVSHELRTPLTAIQGFTEPLQQGAWEEGEADRFLGIIEKEVIRLARLIDDLLILSRLEAVADIPGGRSNLKECTQSALEVLEQKIEERGIEVGVEIQSDLVVDINADDLQQVLINLTDNGITHSPPGSTLFISGGREQDQVFWAIKDQGPGIPEEDQSRVFERFYRVDKGRSRESGGTGLGLSIVRHIVSRAGGRVNLESTPGQGSTFIVYLQAAK